MCLVPAVRTVSNIRRDYVLLQPNEVETILGVTTAVGNVAPDTPYDGQPRAAVFSEGAWNRYPSMAIPSCLARYYMSR